MTRSFRAALLSATAFAFDLLAADLSAAQQPPAPAPATPPSVADQAPANAQQAPPAGVPVPTVKVEQPKPAAPVVESKPKAVAVPKAEAGPPVVPAKKAASSAAPAATAASQPAAATTGITPVSGQTSNGIPTKDLAVDYHPTSATVGTKTDTPLAQTPASIVVIPGAVIEDRKPADLLAAVDTVSGVQTLPSVGLINEFIVRGFETTEVYRDGLRIGTAGSGFGTTFDLANIQSIEILKGPAAMLYGRAQPGGLIEINTKQPLDVSQNSIEQQIGSYDHYRTSFDFTGPLNPQKTVLYRFTGSWVDTESFREFHPSKSFDLAPSVTFRPNAGTELTLNFEIFNKTFQTDYGIPIPYGAVRPDFNIPLGRSFQEPNDPRDHTRDIYAGWTFKQMLAENWQFTNRFLYHNNHSDNLDLVPFYLDSTNTLLRSVADQHYDQDSFSTNAEITGKQTILGFKNEPLVGIDYSHVKGQYYIAGFFPGPDTSINIYNPVYGSLPSSIYQPGLGTPFFGPQYANVFQENTGLYFQDHMTFFDRLHLFIGGRYDWATAGYSTNTSAGTLASSFGEAQYPKPTTDEAYSPRYGALYQVTRTLGVFANYSESFGTNNGSSHTRSGAPLAPETANGYETGLKLELFNKSLSVTAAYYNLTKENIVGTDPICIGVPGCNFSQNIGAVRSNGVEVDITGRVNDYLSVIGSYAYDDIRVTKGTADGFYAVGSRWANVPYNAAALWLKYDVNGYKAPQGLSVGFGAKYAGDRPGESYTANLGGLPNFTIPEYITFDAFAAYKFKFNPGDKVTWAASLNVKNLLNERYYQSAETEFTYNCVPGSLCVHPGEPFTVLGALKAQW